MEVVNVYTIRLNALESKAIIYKNRILGYLTIVHVYCEKHRIKLSSSSSYPPPPPPLSFSFCILNFIVACPVPGFSLLKKV
jgi:hypothetical protein